MSIREAYDRWAQQYDVDSNETRDMDRKATRSMLGGYRFEHVLELGCGTGKNTQWFQHQAAKVTALDFSAEMLNLAADKIDPSRVNLQQADITEPWDVPDESFDLISCNLTLEHIGQLDPVFEQACRKAAPGGWFFVSELHPYKQYTGSKARFDSGDNGVQVLEVYQHHLSDYLRSVARNGFSIEEIEEWFDDDTQVNIPRLITFVFTKP